MKDIKAKILFNYEIAPSYFKMGLEAPRLARIARPGQFVQVRCGETTDPLLRRPLGIHRVKGEKFKVKGKGINAIEILYEVVGKGTKLLSEKRKGDIVNILGPLGNGFSLLPSTFNLPPLTILVAGGIGVAPLVFLAEVLAERKIKSVVLLGAKTKKKILCEKDFKKLGAEVHIATDDGTCGCKGLVSQLCEKILRTTNPAPLTSFGCRAGDEPCTTHFVRMQGRRRTLHHSLRLGAGRATIYACGPEPMLRCIAEISGKYSVHCEALLEEKMACGFGACLGCTVKVRQVGIGQSFINKLTCKDGPVFDTRELIWS